MYISPYVSLSVCLLLELMYEMEEAFIEDYVRHSWRTIVFTHKTLDL